MSGRFVRASKYRHVHGNVAKKEKAYQNVRPASTGESNYIAANKLYWALPIQGGGGPVQVHPHSKVGRLEHNLPKMNMHKGAVLDLAFNPFEDRVLATASEDLTIKISTIPDDISTIDRLEPNVTLEGHQKKLAMISWHPVASNILASIGFDNAVKLWDVSMGKEAVQIDDHPDLPNSIAWNENGSLVATTCKDKFIRVFDPRQKGSVTKLNGPAGGKSRVFWIEGQNRLGAVGFNASNARIYSVYDTKQADPINIGDIDTSASPMIPYFDYDTQVLFVAGKGDSMIRYYEITKEEPCVFYLSECRDTEAVKGACFLPKAACDTKICEIMICYRVMRDWISPVSFVVPRKSDLFQADIFPDTYAGVPALSAEEYLGGANHDPVKRSMKPGTEESKSVAPKSMGMMSKPSGELQRELDAALAKVKALEEENAKLKEENSKLKAN